MSTQNTVHVYMEEWENINMDTQFIKSYKNKRYTVCKSNRYVFNFEQMTLWKVSNPR